MNATHPLFANPETGLVPFGHPLPHDYNPVKEAHEDAHEDAPEEGGARAEAIYRFTFFVVENDGKATTRVFLSLEEAENSLQDSHFPWAEMVKEAFDSYLYFVRGPLTFMGEATRYTHQNGAPRGRGKEAVVIVRKI